MPPTICPVTMATVNTARPRIGTVKAWETKSEISKDDAKRHSDEIQKLTDQAVKRVDEALAEKEKDIKAV